MVARLAACGSIVMIEDTAVHRELGGVSQSSKKTAQALGLPGLHALFPYLSVAAGAFADLSAGKSVYAQFRPVPRRAAGALAFAVLLVRAFTTSCAERLVMIRNRLFCRVHAWAENGRGHRLRLADSRARKQLRRRQAQRRNAGRAPRSGATRILVDRDRRGERAGAADRRGHPVPVADGLPEPAGLFGNADKGRCCRNPDRDRGEAAQRRLARLVASRQASQGDQAPLPRCTCRRFLPQHRIRHAEDAGP